MIRLYAITPSLLLVAWATAAQPAPADTGIERVVVTAGALPGTALDPDKMPFNIQTVPARI